MVAVLRPNSCAHLQVALVEDQGHRLWVPVPVHCSTSDCDGGLMGYAFTLEAIELELISFASGWLVSMTVRLEPELLGLWR